MVRKRKVDDESSSDCEEQITRIIIPSKPIPTSSGIQTFTLDFLKNLSIPLNNNKQYMDLNKNIYLASKQNILDLIENILQELKIHDEQIGNNLAKEAIYRINRDVRFSMDKSPYKNHFGCYISKDGKKSCYAGYYVHITAGESFIGGGLHSPPAKILKKIRDRISKSSDLLEKVLKSDEIKKWFGDCYGKFKENPNRLKTRPKGFDKDHKDIDLLCLKSFTVSRVFERDQVLAEDFTEIVVGAMKALTPFIQLLNSFVQE
jgi:uncharacterized protein (TIGR02453 family)